MGRRGEEKGAPLLPVPGIYRPVAPVGADSLVERIPWIEIPSAPFFPAVATAEHRLLDPTVIGHVSSPDLVVIVVESGRVPSRVELASGQRHGGAQQQRQQHHRRPPPPPPPRPPHPPLATASSDTAAEERGEIVKPSPNRPSSSSSSSSSSFAFSSASASSCRLSLRPPPPPSPDRSIDRSPRAARYVLLDQHPSLPCPDASSIAANRGGSIIRFDSIDQREREKGDIYVYSNSPP